MSKIIAIMPALNEEERIGAVIEKTWPCVDDIVVVDDGSTDQTARIAEDLKAKVIHFTDNKGVGFATRAGCDHAIALGADIIITIDADGQHNPADIPDLVKPVLAGTADITFGIRPRDRRMPVTKRLANAFFSIFSTVLFGMPIEDALTGYHAFSKEAYPLLRWDSDGYGVVTELVYKTAKNNFRSAQVPVQTIYIGKTNGMRKRDGLHSLFLMLKWKIGLR
jgi:glycosyltransferase involved in cell wall biosynthesis